MAVPISGSVSMILFSMVCLLCFIRPVYCLGQDTPGILFAKSIDSLLVCLTFNCFHVLVCEAPGEVLVTVTEDVQGFLFSDKVVAVVVTDSVNKVRFQHVSDL